MDCSMPGFPVHHQLSELAQTHVHQLSDLILCCPHLLLPSIFPSIRVFSNESVLCIRWPKYWSFSISPSNEYSGLISFRIDWFDLLAVQGTLKSLPQHHIGGQHHPDIKTQQIPQKRKLQANITDEHRCNCPEQIVAIQIQQ